MHLYHVATPTADHHAATKKSCEDYVKSYAMPRKRPPGLIFKKAGHTNAGSLQAGEFFVATNSNVYFYPRSFDGVDLLVDSSGADVTTKVICGIWKTDADLLYMFTSSKIAFTSSGNRYIRVEKDATIKSLATITGNCFVSIPGLTS